MTPNEPLTKWSNSGIWSVGRWVIYIGDGACHMPTFDIFRRRSHPPEIQKVLTHEISHAYKAQAEEHFDENVVGCGARCNPLFNGRLDRPGTEPTNSPAFEARENPGRSVRDLGRGRKRHRLPHRRRCHSRGQ